MEKCIRLDLNGCPYRGKDAYFGTYGQDCRRYEKEGGDSGQLRRPDISDYEYITCRSSIQCQFALEVAIKSDN